MGGHATAATSPASADCALRRRCVRTGHVPQFRVRRQQSTQPRRARQGTMRQADDPRPDPHRQLRLGPQRGRPEPRRRVRVRTGRRHRRRSLSRARSSPLRSLEPRALSHAPETGAVPVGPRVLARRLDGERLVPDARRDPPRHPAPRRAAGAADARRRRHGPRDAGGGDVGARPAGRPRAAPHDGHHGFRRAQPVDRASRRPLLRRRHRGASRAHRARHPRRAHPRHRRPGARRVRRTRRAGRRAPGPGALGTDARRPREARSAAFPTSPAPCGRCADRSRG